MASAAAVAAFTCSYRSFSACLISSFSAGVSLTSLSVDWTAVFMLKAFGAGLAGASRCVLVAQRTATEGLWGLVGGVVEVVAVEVVAVAVVAVEERAVVGFTLALTPGLEPDTSVMMDLEVLASSWAMLDFGCGDGGLFDGGIAVSGVGWDARTAPSRKFGPSSAAATGAPQSDEASGMKAVEEKRSL